MHRVWVSFCSSLELSVFPPISALAVVRTNHVFSLSECPERQQVDALWSWWPANLVTLTQGTNLCITSPYTTPIPFLLIPPLPSDRTNTAATGRKRGTFFLLSPKDQCWLCLMGFMACPFNSWHGCEELGVSSGPWQSHRHFWAVRVTLSIRSNTGHSSDGWGHSQPKHSWQLHHSAQPTSAKVRPCQVRTAGSRSQTPAQQRGECWQVVLGQWDSEWLSKKTLMLHLCYIT